MTDVVHLMRYVILTVRWQIFTQSNKPEKRHASGQSTTTKPGDFSEQFQWKIKVELGDCHHSLNRKSLSLVFPNYLSLSLLWTWHYSCRSRSTYDVIKRAKCCFDNGHKGHLWKEERGRCSCHQRFDCIPDENGKNCLWSIQTRNKENTLGPIHSKYHYSQLSLK